MLISHQKQFVFVHIYKTAGTSVRDLFTPYARLRDRVVYQYRLTSRMVGFLAHRLGWESRGNAPFTGVAKHGPASEGCNYLGAARWKSYFTFAFVRNPFDWIVSQYAYIRETKDHPEHAISQNWSFADFVNREIPNHAKRQWHFVSNVRGEVIVDFIGHFEQLQEDILTVCQRLDIPPGPLGHRNRTRSRDGRGYAAYYDENTRALVADYFAIDFERFGYSPLLEETREAVPAATR